MTETEKALMAAGSKLAGNLSVALGGLGGIWHPDALADLRKAIPEWEKAQRVARRTKK